MTPALSTVASLFGKRLPAPPGKAHCPLRDHHRKDKTFRVYRSPSGDEMWKCWSCDPPANTGDGVALYAALAGVEIGQALRDLRERGLVEDRPRPGRDHAPMPGRALPPKLPLKSLIRGEAPRKIALLDPDVLDGWRFDRRELVERFAQMRGLHAGSLRDLGMVDIAPSAVGFVYRTETGTACRVKVRGVFQKTFWVEPKGSDGARALAPLYLVERLDASLCGKLRVVVVTEGEVDALTLATVGHLPNVVSLPDGSDSAKSVELTPLARWADAWVIATDEDEPGEKAFADLRKRAASVRIDAVRVHWQKRVGDELVVYKDANDARVRGHFVEADYATCVDVALQERYGYATEWRQS